jgi:hypothetical protein
MKKLILFAFISQILIGCVGDGHGSLYKEMMLNGKIVEYPKTNNGHITIEKNSAIINGSFRYVDDNGTPMPEENELKTEKCVYGLILGIFPPLNFWDVRFTDKQDINYAIKKFQKQDPKIKGLRYISTSYTYVSFRVFGWGCTKIERFPIYDDITK